MKITPKKILVAGLLVGALLWAATSRAIEGQTNSGSGGGSTSITSGTTPVTGGTNKDVCFNDSGVVNCGDNGIQYTKSNGTLVSTALKSSQYQTSVTVINTASSPYTVLATDSLIQCQTTTGNITVNLPAATGSGRILTLWSLWIADASVNVTPNGSDTINGSNSAIDIGGVNLSNFPILQITDYASGKWVISGGNVVTTLYMPSGGHGPVIDPSRNLNQLGNITEIAGLASLNTLKVSSDSIVSTMARLPLFFDEGKEAALVANESMGTFKTVKAITIENIELDVKISPTCSVSEQITCYDCGNTAGACTSGQASTIMNAVTIASGAARQSADESIATANVAAGEYISCLITAGTCTVSDNAITMMARPQ